MRHSRHLCTRSLVSTYGLPVDVYQLQAAQSGIVRDNYLTSAVIGESLESEDTHVLLSFLLVTHTYTLTLVHVLAQPHVHAVPGFQDTLYGLGAAIHGVVLCMHTSMCTYVIKVMHASVSFFKSCI
jgi:hypothetical protein